MFLVIVVDDGLEEGGEAFIVEEEGCLGCQDLVDSVNVESDVGESVLEEGE